MWPPLAPFDALTIPHAITTPPIGTPRLAWPHGIRSPSSAISCWLCCVLLGRAGCFSDTSSGLVCFTWPRLAYRGLPCPHAGIKRAVPHCIVAVPASDHHYEPQPPRLLLDVPSQPSGLRLLFMHACCTSQKSYRSHAPHRSFILLGL